MYDTKHKKNTNHKPLIIIVALAVILLASGGVFYLKKHKSAQTTAPTNQPTAVNLSPPTQEDKARVDANKQKIVQQQGQSTSGSNNTSSKTTVTPTISYAGVYNDGVEVGAYISGIVEDGGTCTATFTLDSSTVTKSTTGVANSSTTACPAITAPLSNFAQKGTWTVTVSYSSPKAAGISSSKSITIQ